MQAYKLNLKKSQVTKPKKFFSAKSSSIRSAKKDEDDLVEMYLGYSERTHVSTCVNVYIDEPVAACKYYRGVVDRVTGLSEDDQVVYHISSPGGDLSGLISLVEANRQTEAEVVAVLVGDCHSAASMLALTCDNIAVLDSATMLVHHVSYGTSGKASDIKAYVQHNEAFCDKFFREVYEGFLTEVEIDLCINHGKELWLQADDIRSRLENKMQYMRDKAELEQMELDEEEYVDAFPEIMQPEELEEDVWKEAPKKVTKGKPKKATSDAPTDELST